MNVILAESVRGLGSPGDEVDVARGYAENYLIPKKIAVYATKENIKIWSLKKQKIQEQEAALREEAAATAETLSKSRITIKKRVGAEDKIHGTVSTKSLEEEIEKQLGMKIEKKNIILDAPIKTIGEHIIKIELFADIIGELLVCIEPEE